ncbi:MAG: hypothetical protein K8T90_03545, partial [Planctomycetes bacterium]|nr:hypothetical protein [Planctomycetota bacterium]
MRWTSLAAAVLFAPFAFASTAQEAGAPLARPDGAVQPEARGNCSVRDGTDFQRFTLVVEGVNADRALSVFLGDGNEHLLNIGDLPAGANRREFNKTTREGGELPYGVESVRTLGGRAVEIRDAEAHVVLRGHVPVLDAPPVDPPPVDPPAAEPIVARSVFHRTEFAGERESRGTVVVTKRTDGGAIRVEVGRLAPETGYLFSVGARGSMTLVDDFRTNREGGAAIERDTAHEPGLPIGADGVGGLAGKRIEI